NRKPAGIAYNNVKPVLFEKHDPVFYIRKAAVRNAKNYCFWMNPKSNNWKGLTVADGSGQCIVNRRRRSCCKRVGVECLFVCMICQTECLVWYGVFASIHTNLLFKLVYRYFQDVFFYYII